MEFGQDELKDQYSDIKEEDQDQEEEEEEDDHNQVRNTFTNNNNTSTRLDPLSFCAPSISSSSSSSSKKWPHIISNNSSTGNNSHLQLMDYLSLKTGGGGAAVESSNANSGLENRGGSGGGGGGGFSLMYSGGEREHMFDKVVTPSDVGKLNRLVIPKQHAERYFPLDSASNEKGLLLNFEDRSGKSWRFRYSYWNSSQSYVMTKGWSRFVKEKKLDAGDIVSFERESPAAAGGRLFIDWRRRTHHQYHPHHHHHHQQYHHLLSNPASLFPIDPFHQPRWGGGGEGRGMLHSLPLSMPVPMQPPQRSIENLQYNYNSSMIHYPSYNHHHHHHHHHQQQHQFQYQHHHHQDYVNSPAAAGPAVAAAAAAGPSKRLRLFGVNMEYCPINEQEAQASSDHERIASSSVQYPLQVRIPTHDNSSPILPLSLPLPLPRPTSFPAEFSHEYKGKSANNSLSFDLDP